MRVGPRHGEGAGAQRARGFAEEAEFLLAGLADQTSVAGLQILDPALDVGIAVGDGRAAIALEIHRPHVDSRARAKTFISEYSPAPGTVRSKLERAESDEPCTRNSTGSGFCPGAGAARRLRYM